MSENATQAKKNPKKLSWRETHLVAALARAATVREAAQEVGCAESTAWRTLARPHVREEISRRQASLLAGVGQSLAEDIGLARALLRQIVLDEEAARGVQIRAAGMLLEAGMHFMEIFTLNERLARLEEFMMERRR